MKKPETRFLTSEPLPRLYEWHTIKVNGKDIQVAWDSEAQYVHWDSWSKVLPMPVDELSKWIKNVEKGIKALRESIEDTRPKCPVCKGKGTVRGDDIMTLKHETCDHCGGSGINPIKCTKCVSGYLDVGDSYTDENGVKWNPEPKKCTCHDGRVFQTKGARE
jgi:hypothetical protein